MKYKILNKEGNCVFEEYDNISNKMTTCNCKAKVKVGNKYVCNNHLSHVMMTDAKPEMEDSNGKIVKFKSDFLKLTKDIEIKERQLTMEF